MTQRIVSDAEWLAERRELLAEEKTFQRQRDALASRRRELPWRRIVKPYSFEGEEGPVALPDLFGGHSQLVVYHFMFHPDWEEGCKSCSFWADSYDGSSPHLAARDTRLVAVSRARLPKLLAYRDRMGWSFPWYSSADSDFNFDFDVSFTAEQLERKDGSYNYRDGNIFGEEMPGISVFCRGEDGEIYHTYSTYSRGLDPFNATYQLLDIVPKGRDEDALTYVTDWLRRHDSY